MSPSIGGFAALALAHPAAAIAAARAAATQAAPARLPAEPPIGGPLWTLVIPALLLLIATGLTFMLYRKFAGK